MRFITMLNHLGLTVSWENAVKFFDRCKAKKGETCYQHLRLFKYTGPTMWNFTGEAVLIPSVEGLKDILQDKNASLRPQKSVLQLDPNEIFIQ